VSLIGNWERAVGDRHTGRPCSDRTSSESELGWEGFDSESFFFHSFERRNRLLSSPVLEFAIFTDGYRWGLDKRSVSCIISAAVSLWCLEVMHEAGGIRGRITLVVVKIRLGRRRRVAGIRSLWLDGQR